MSEVTWRDNIRHSLHTQDNRITALPMFIVQQRDRIYGMDPDYSDTIVWIDDENSYSEVEEKEAEKLETAHYNGDATDGYTRTAYQDHWVFVTACFTEQGCMDYLKINGHNLTDPRIYVASGCRNREWQQVRNLLMG